MRLAGKVAHSGGELVPECFKKETTVNRPSFLSDCALGQNFLQAFFDHELEQVSNSVGIAPLVVIPTYQLKEVFV